LVDLRFEAEDVTMLREVISELCDRYERRNVDDKNRLGRRRSARVLVVFIFEQSILRLGRALDVRWFDTPRLSRIADNNLLLLHFVIYNTHNCTLIPHEDLSAFPLACIFEAISYIKGLVIPNMFNQWTII